MLSATSVEPGRIRRKSRLPAAISSRKIPGLRLERPSPNGCRDADRKNRGCPIQGAGARALVGGHDVARIALGGIVEESFEIVVDDLSRQVLAGLSGGL